MSTPIEIPALAEPFGAWLTAARTARGWSTEQLAELADVDLGQLERVEAGGELRQRSTRQRLRQVLLTGGPLPPPGTDTTTEPAPRPRLLAPVDDSPLGRLALQVRLLGGPVELTSLESQAAAFARWASVQTRLLDVPLRGLLPGVQSAPGRPSELARTKAARAQLDKRTDDSWARLGQLTPAQLEERLGAVTARLVLKAAATAWTHLFDQ